MNPGNFGTSKNIHTIALTAPKSVIVGSITILRFIWMVRIIPNGLIESKASF